MSTTDTGQEPNPTTPPPGTDETGTPTGTDQPGAEVPPWERDGEPFDSARAWNLIRNLRAEVAATRKAEPAASTATGDGSGDTAELARQVATLSTDLARERVARKHALPDDLLGLLGDGDEAALTTRAEALIAWRDKTTTDASTPPRRPAQKPRGGADPTATATETDPAKLAAAVAARRR
ncbi:hypothetical protein [Stackebrandtia soli]|uniref:hypothetical protein n=1 Tax=Stackebrandtia soli TaxID=1892856 RepID=UPI0039EB0A1E